MNEDHHDDGANHYDEREKALEKLDPAWAKAVFYFRTGIHFGHSSGEVRARGLVKIHGAIEVFRSRFEAGDTLSLLHAISVCAEENLPLPSWLATAYGEALGSFLKPGKISSLDEVFFSSGMPVGSKKGAQARIDWELGVRIWVSTWEAAIEDEAITSLDEALTAALKNSSFGVKKTKARELFLMIDKNQSEHLKGQSGHSQDKSFSRFLELRRKPKP